jgi:transposase
LIGDLQDFSVFVVDLIGKKFEKNPNFWRGIVDLEEVVWHLRIYLESSGVYWEIVGHNISHDAF